MLRADLFTFAFYNSIVLADRYIAFSGKGLGHLSVLSDYFPAQTQLGFVVGPMPSFIKICRFVVLSALGLESVTALQEVT